MSVVYEFRPIISERLSLRRFRPEDGERFWRYRTDEVVARYQGDVSRFTEEMSAEFAREQSVQEPAIPGTWFQLAIELRSSGEMIGDCGIHTLAEQPGWAELGITIAREHQRRGYAREALTAVLDYVFGSLGQQGAISLTDPRNTDCIRLLEGLGMRREATLIGHVLVGGEWLDDVRYEISAEEWSRRAC